MNIVLAVEHAKRVGAKIYGIVGKADGITAQLADVCIVVDTEPALRTAIVEGFQAVSVAWRRLPSGSGSSTRQMGRDRIRPVEVAVATQRPALFLDRDGVLNPPVWDTRTSTFESPLAVADVSLIAGAAAGIVRANSAAVPVVIVSNQPSAAKGAVSVDDLATIHSRVLELLAVEGAQIDASYLCLHHPRRGSGARGRVRLPKAGARPVVTCRPGSWTSTCAGRG